MIDYYHWTHLGDWKFDSEAWPDPTGIGARKRRVYLPTGAEWTHVDSGRRFAGGDHVVIEARLDRIPVLVRDDAHLPLKVEDG